MKNFSESIKMQDCQPLYTTNKLKVKRLDVHSFLNCCYIPVIYADYVTQILEIMSTQSKRSAKPATRSKERSEDR